jgi:hypothetical protein
MLLHAVVLAVAQLTIDKFDEAFQRPFTSDIVGVRHWIPSGALSVSAGRWRSLETVIARDTPQRPLECATRTSKPGPNGADRQIQRLRNLAVLEPFDIG